ncbi:MAG: aminotransferase class I/II-fold pyridoxal phosphate-dependent enzyme [Thermoplasmata archaeon]
MRFPLGDWIDDHSECRHHLGSSGMAGTVRHPTPTPAAVRSARDVDLLRAFADLVEVDRSRVFLTHGATEANAWAVTYLARRRRGRVPRCRVELPEYPPLFDVAASAGFRVVPHGGPSDLAILSQPRNPVGDRWSGSRLAEWADSARATVVDETFREFTPARSVQHLDLPGLWTTGSLTKAYGGDDLRVGYIVAPEEEQAEFARFHGLVTDELANYSVAGALATLAARARILREVRSVVGRNAALWRRANPEAPALAGPVTFDDPVPPDGDRFARRCLRASVLVCPGSLFGRASGVRVGLTRRSFPRDLSVYLRVRDAARNDRSGASPRGGERRRLDRAAR